MTNNPKTPVKWPIKKISSIVEFAYGQNLPTEKRVSGQYEVFGSNGVVGTHDKFLVEGPGIIIGRKGSIGKVLYTNNNFWPIDTTYFIKPLEELDLMWLSYCLQTLRLDKLNSATGVPGLNRNDVYSKTVAFPPLAIQQKIASTLSTIDDAIQKTDQIIEKTEKLKNGLMNELLTKGICHAKFKKSKLGEIPENWEVTHFINIAELQRGFDLPSSKRVKGNYPLISSNGITDSISEYKVHGPGVITGRSGTIGNVFYTEDNFWPLNTTLYIKNFNNNIPRFLFYILKKLELKKFLSGTGVPTLNRNIIHGIEIAVPSSIVEQEKISHILDSVQIKIDREKQKKNKLQLLKTGLMNDIFNQKVEV